MSTNNVGLNQENCFVPADQRVGLTIENMSKAETDGVHEEHEHIVSASKDASTSIVSCKKIVPAKALSQKTSTLFLDSLRVGMTGAINVMVGRIWDVNTFKGRYLSTDFVVSDTKGHMMHCYAKASVAHTFLRIKEGSIYNIKNFVVHLNRDEYRIRKDDTYMLEFDGETTVRKLSMNPNGFVRYPFSLVELEGLEDTKNRDCIDIAGYVTNVGRTNTQKSGSKSLEFYLLNSRGQSIRVTLWGGLGDILVEKKTKHSGMCPVVIVSATVKTYSNKVYISSCSSTAILDDDAIPAIKSLKKTQGDVPLIRPVLGDTSELMAGTIENLLMWVRNRRNDSKTFHCNVTIDCVRTKNGWSFPSCGGDRCKKGATRKEGKWFCDSCNRTIEYPVLKYRLELDVSDGTARMVVVLFDETASVLVGCSAESVMTLQDSEDDGNLPAPISNIIGTSHTLELKSHTYYEYGTFESFTCWKIIGDKQDGESGSSSSAFVSLNSTPKFKRLKQQPSLSTPAKPNEGVVYKSVPVDDSASDQSLDSSFDEEGKRKQTISDDVEDHDVGDDLGSAGVKKKRRSYKYVSDAELSE